MNTIDIIRHAFPVWSFYDKYGYLVAIGVGLLTFVPIWRLLLWDLEVPKSLRFAATLCLSAMFAFMSFGALQTASIQHSSFSELSSLLNDPALKVTVNLDETSRAETVSLDSPERCVKQEPLLGKTATVMQPPLHCVLTTSEAAKLTASLRKYRPELVSALERNTAPAQQTR